MEKKQVDILSEKYTIYLGVDEEFYKEKTDGDEPPEGGIGICFYGTKEIFILEGAYKAKLVNETIRHELFHAFLCESGLGQTTLMFEGGWSNNEEMVDWFAIQSPKIFRVYKELDLL